MIPVFAKLRVRRAGRRGFRLWIPLFLVWLLLLPLALLMLPVFILACWIGRVGSLRALRVFWGILNGLTGTRVEVGSRRHAVLVHIV